MIGKLTGTIDSFETDHLILDVSGIGYIIYASSRTLGAVGQVGEVVSLLINMQVREDSMTLYGFADKVEQGWFRLLTSVQGVGAKAGLSILAATPADQLGFVIASQDKAALTRADGVGPKLAARILTELKDKVGQIEISASSAGGAGAKASQDGAAQVTVSKADEDAVSALTNLGYARAEAYKAVMQAKSKANDNDTENVEMLIKLALTELSA